MSSNNKIGNYSPDYQIGEIIGCGRYGQVVRIVHEQTGLQYALKRMHNYGCEDQKKLHLNEIEVMRSFRYKDSIVQYYGHEFDNENGFTYILMELCDTNLKELIQSMPHTMYRDLSDQANKVEFYISWRIIHDIAIGLEYLHSHRPWPIVHSDLKPENILIVTRGNCALVKISDFGLSRFINKKYVSGDVGTDRYKAPEVREELQYNTKADIYGLVIIALEVFGVNKRHKSPEKAKSIKGQGLLEKFKRILVVLKRRNPLKNRFKNFYKICESCINVPAKQFEDRPSCAAILMKLHLCLAHLVKSPITSHKLSKHCKRYLKIDNIFNKFLLNSISNDLCGLSIIMSADSIGGTVFGDSVDRTQFVLDYLKFISAIQSILFIDTF